MSELSVNVGNTKPRRAARDVRERVARHRRKIIRCPLGLSAPVCRGGIKYLVAAC